VAARFASTPVVMLIELLRSPSLIELMIGFRRLYGKTRMQEEPTSPFAFSGSGPFYASRLRLGFSPELGQNATARTKRKGEPSL